VYEPLLKRKWTAATVVTNVNGQVAVQFNKSFIDAITVMPESDQPTAGYAIGGYYAFNDVANPSQFTAILRRTDTGSASNRKNFVAS